MKKHVFLMICGAICLTVAACSKKAAVDPAIASCPEKSMAMLQQNQEFFKKVMPGVTPAKRLGELKGLKRKATLVKTGEAPLPLLFFQTGLPTCSWDVYTAALTPVVVKDGVIAAFGDEAVKGMTAHGWYIKEAQWPWQSYDFGYLPSK